MEPREKDLSEIRNKLKTLLVDHLNLQNVTAEQIQDDAPLFGGDIGLDSLDASDQRSARHAVADDRLREVGEFSIHRRPSLIEPGVIHRQRLKRVYTGRENLS